MAILRIAYCVVVALVCSLAAESAQAAPVLVMGENGRVQPHPGSLAPASSFPPVRARGAAAKPRALAAKQRKRTVPGELAALLAAGAIDQPTHDVRRASYDEARRVVRSLKGTRRAELSAVVSTLEDVAARGQLTPSRIPALWRRSSATGSGGRTARC